MPTPSFVSSHPARAARRPGRPTLLQSAMVLSLGVHAAGAWALDFKWGEVDATLTGGLSYGLAVRTTGLDPQLLGQRNALANGIGNTNVPGRNQDDGNLNYRSGDVFSQVVKGFGALTLKRDNLRATLRLHAWHDIALANTSVPWGNTTNGFAAGSSLSDAGAGHRAEFSGISVGAANVTASFTPMGVPTDIIAGYQNIGWRGAGMAPSALAVLDPVDTIAARRPGAFPEDALVPVPALRMRLKPSQSVAVDAFAQTAFRPTQLPLCGTFFAAGDFGPDGCDRILVAQPAAAAATRSDPLLLANGNFILSDTHWPGGGGQFGVSMRWTPAPKTEIGVAFARYDSRTPALSITKSTIPGALPFAPGDPRNAVFHFVYPTGIRALSVDARTEAGGGTVFGAVTLTPNQVFRYPGAEMVQLFTSPIAAANLFRAQERATAAGGTFDAYDRHRTTDLQFGGILPLKDWLGASNVTLRAEANVALVHGLPDPNVLRYARAEVFGNGPIGGTCPAGTSAITCSNNGYVTPSAWNFLLRATGSYPQALGSFTLRPTLTYQQDVHGYSNDGAIREGRRLLTVGVDFVRANLVLNATVVHNIGRSTYDNTSDRNFVAFSGSMRF